MLHSLEFAQRVLSSTNSSVSKERDPIVLLLSVFFIVNSKICFFITALVFLRGVFTLEDGGFSIVTNNEAARIARSKAYTPHIKAMGRNA